MNRVGVGTRLLVFARSVLMLAIVAIGVPAALLFVAQERFGGGSPFAGVSSPSTWSLDRIGSALSDRLTDRTIADIVIRVALVVAWVAVIVIVLTVAAELAHMVRHDGLAMPDIRGLGVSQRTARAIAAGLLVIIPLFTSPGSAIAKPGASLVAEPRAPMSIDAADHLAPSVAPPAGMAGDQFSRAPSERSAAGGEYVVRSGDSVFGIAERMAGPDQASIASYAEALVDANLGRQMPDGRTFDNAAFLDVGWVLELPPTPNAIDAGADVAADETHLVERGDSLWSIAEEELGDPMRWPEVFEANEGRTFDDGGTLRDPDLIQPGWEIVVPSDETVGSTTPEDPVEKPVEKPVEVATDAVVVSADAAGTDEDAVDGAADGVEAATDAPEVVADLGVTEITHTDPLPEAQFDATIGPSRITHVEPHAAVTLPLDGDEFDAGEAFESPGGESEGLDAAGGPQRDNVWEGTEATGATDEADPSDVGRTAAAAESDPADGVSVAVGESAAEPDAAEDGSPGSPEQDDEDAAPSLLTLGRAAMLSAGVLTLLAVRRRNQLRRARPRSRLPEPMPTAAATERILRSIDSGERFARVDIATRAVALSLIDRDERVLAVSVAADGALELRSTGPVELTAPWEGVGSTWHLAASVPLEMLADDARRVGAPCPTLVQLGSDESGRDVYVDLEALEAVEVGGPGAQADAVVAALAATLAASVLAEVSTLVGLGVPDDAFLGHRNYVPVRDPQRAFEAASDAIGSTATMTRSTFDLRARGTSGETWEPAVILAGAAAGTITARSNRTGLALVSASPIQGPSSRLAPDGDAWLLLPAGIRLTPVGLTPDDLASIANLLTIAEREPDEYARPLRRSTPAAGDDTIVEADNGFPIRLDDHSHVHAGPAAHDDVGPTSDEIVDRTDHARPSSDFAHSDVAIDPDADRAIVGLGGGREQPDADDMAEPTGANATDVDRTEIARVADFDDVARSGCEPDDTIVDGDGVVQPSDSGDIIEPTGASADGADRTEGTQFAADAAARTDGASDDDSTIIGRSGDGDQVDAGGAVEPTGVSASEVEPNDGAAGFDVADNTANASWSADDGTGSEQNQESGDEFAGEVVVSDNRLIGADRSSPAVDPSPPHRLLVRLLGAVAVVDLRGDPVEFERSKTRELVAWLATHRERSTRSAARTALWELDVRDATFANVVSEARRALARFTEPPLGEEWVGRTNTDALPLHALVLTDADLIRHALDLARLQPPAQAIATLGPVVELITGMPFAGTSYLWPDSEGITSNLVLLATTATTELAAHCLSIGDIEGVFRATGRGLQVLPGHEELIGLRMEAHARAGDHAGVRQEWESYERVINGDPWSDGEPAPKLVELRRRLLNPSR